LATACFGLAAVACSIRPLPQDATGLTTYQIVSHIRCEARDAVRSYALAAIRADPAVAADLQSGAFDFENFDIKRLRGHAAEVVDKYRSSAIAYDFTFDITETNELTAGADFLRTLDRGPFKLGIGAGNERERQNIRNFRIADTFENLATKVGDDYCTNPGKQKNWLYPITGTIGLAELVGTFLDLNQSGNLAPGEKVSVPVIADTIEFTTKFSGNANPSVELAAVGRDFQLVKANIGTKATRQDIHKVVIAMSLQPPPAKGKATTPAASAQKRAIEELDVQLYRDSILETKSLRKRLEQIIQ
jgi:hypothetical protein